MGSGSRSPDSIALCRTSFSRRDTRSTPAATNADSAVGAMCSQTQALPGICLPANTGWHPEIPFASEFRGAPCCPIRPRSSATSRPGCPSGTIRFSAGRDTLGVAVDIGTTTVAMILAELTSGKVLAKATSLNAQVSRGDNVLTRIQLCQDDKTNIARLKDDFWRATFHPLLQSLFRDSGTGMEDLAGVIVGREYDHAPPRLQHRSHAFGNRAVYPCFSGPA